MQIPKKLKGDHPKELSSFCFAWNLSSWSLEIMELVVIEAWQPGEECLEGKSWGYTE